MNVNRSSFRMVTTADTDPDLSYLGEYASRPAATYIDREERGDLGRGEYRYFNAGCGDPEYIEDDYARYEAYNANDWYMVGIRAAVDLDIPCKSGGTIRQRIESPGLWGVESDSGEEYIASIFAGECDVLADMLEGMGITVEGVANAV